MLGENWKTHSKNQEVERSLEPFPGHIRFSLRPMRTILGAKFPAGHVQCWSSSWSGRGTRRAQVKFQMHCRRTWEGRLLNKEKKRRRMGYHGISWDITPENEDGAKSDLERRVFLYKPHGCSGSLISFTTGVLGMIVNVMGNQSLGRHSESHISGLWIHSIRALEP